ncbi:hypothetical protein [Qipengyuania huizhouensis]|uniref:hypothetical protein n=1 Tax=Qipengyuania huizhouensis TaxID=2867245 RepID=UPI00181C124B|nr:hypothetical protein [Qipengyuania huizhouensis]MBA4765074.1 hypothetical protein [Erythrobacter sp.]MBL4858446.1 hypothetical protein [Erythrobacter sp.]MBX7461156.1 hypothetical protein [Qipengyuania huizhouensis]
MRRALVLSNEAARHWMRASIPHRRRHYADMPDGQTVDWKLTAQDVRGVATTYFATVAAVLAFII